MTEFRDKTPWHYWESSLLLCRGIQGCQFPVARGPGFSLQLSHAKHNSRLGAMSVAPKIDCCCTYQNEIIAWDYIRHSFSSIMEESNVHTSFYRTLSNSSLIFADRGCIHKLDRILIIFASFPGYNPTLSINLWWQFIHSCLLLLKYHAGARAVMQQ